MASRRSEDLLASLRGCARRGDWEGVQKLAETLPLQQPPGTAGELRAYLRDLEETLLVARAARAGMVESLARLNAVAGFNRARAGAPPRRQEFGETAEF